MNFKSEQTINWFKKGYMLEINGYKHFVYDSKTDKPVLMILHGFPTCSFDYHKAIPYLESHYRVVIHDHLGFGFSDKPLNYSYSLMDQTDQALLLWQAIGIKKGVVLAHDYGTSIATELLSRLNQFGRLAIDIDALIMCNGSVHIEMAKLRLIQKLLGHAVLGSVVAKFSTKKTFARNMSNIFFDRKKLSNDEIDAMWEMMEHNQGRKVLHQVAQYPKERYKFWHRWIGALQKTQLPIKIIWAMNDPIAIKAIGTTIANETKNSELFELQNLGHFPMLESPGVWSNAVIKSLEQHIL